MPDRCPSCQQPRIERLGIGTERVEAVVRERFPDARVARLDRDTAGDGRGWTRCWRAMHAGEIDVLVGTQMVTKGHDFPGVTLVGVLSPDQTLNLPDFRAAERTFQLLAQVAGRAGRGDRPGRVLIQTYKPDHPAIAAVADARLRGVRARRAGDARGDATTRRSRAWSRCASTRATPTRRRRPRARRRTRRAAAGGAAVRVRGPGGGAAGAAARPHALAGLAVVARSRGGGRGGARRRRRGRRRTGDLRVVVDVDPHSTL